MSPWYLVILSLIAVCLAHAMPASKFDWNLLGDERGDPGRSDPGDSRSSVSASAGTASHKGGLPVPLAIVEMAASSHRDLRRTFDARAALATGCRQGINRSGSVMAVGQTAEGSLAVFTSGR